ncbi:hypothetical protein [Roseibium sp. Sym1]|uniref:hypothetical protein n=1 Tax=Roseibium sp. Sym1 TaxID=3016006 RepID=UPI0022B5ACE9|nr:hypothetical protein [Roseibium sp. Sym1]
MKPTELTVYGLGDLKEESEEAALDFIEAIIDGVVDEVCSLQDQKLPIDIGAKLTITADELRTILRQQILD